MRRSGVVRHIGLSMVAAMTVVAVSCERSPDAASTATADAAMERMGANDPLAVEAIVAEQQTLVGDIVASGLIRGASEITVVSETQGIVREVSFTLGQAVEQGDLLVAMDETIQALTVDEARESLASAELDLASTERLVGSGNASQTQLSTARSTLAGTRSRLAQAEKALADRRIEAPISGLVASKERLVQVGNQLTPGSPVARIVDLSELETVVSLGEREIQYVAAGSPAYVSFAAAGEREIPAYVHAIAAGSDANTGSFPVIVRWTNRLGSRARSGLSATVRIPPSGSPRAILVPASAVQQAGDESYLFVATEDGRAERRAVATGERVGERVAVTAGLTIGERVIVTGLGTIADGSAVTVSTPGGFAQESP